MPCWKSGGIKCDYVNSGFFPHCDIYASKNGKLETHKLHKLHVPNCTYVGPKMKIDKQITVLEGEKQFRNWVFHCYPNDI